MRTRSWYSIFLLSALRVGSSSRFCVQSSYLFYPGNQVGAFTARCNRKAIFCVVTFKLHNSCQEFLLRRPVERRLVELNLFWSVAKASCMGSGIIAVVEFDTTVTTVEWATCALSGVLC